MVARCQLRAMRGRQAGATRHRPVERNGHSSLRQLRPCSAVVTGFARRPAVGRRPTCPAPPATAPRWGGRSGTARRPLPRTPKLLPGHLDVAALAGGVRLPLPAVAVSRQADGSPAGEDRRPFHSDPLETRQPVVRNQHRAGGPASRQARADCPLSGRCRSGARRPHRAVDEGHPARTGGHHRPVPFRTRRRPRPARSRARAATRVLGLEAGPVRRVEGLHADGADRA